MVMNELPVGKNLGLKLRNNMYIYCVISDSRERHEPVLLVTTDIKKAYKRARQYIIGYNRDMCNTWMAPENRKMSDKEFYVRWASAWLVCPSILRKKLTF